jgi:hypothetical protein
MKCSGIILFGIVSITAGAHDPDVAPQRKVVMCFENYRDPILLRSAAALAGKIYAGIGVEVEWRYTLRSCPADAIVVNFREGTPDRVLPGALAYSKPFEGIHMEVFYDRIVRMAEPKLLPILLSHVLVHESTHLLQGVASHSETGIMKARWNEHDFSEMAWSPLPFIPSDVTLIYLGLDKRAERLISSRR